MFFFCDTFDVSRLGCDIFAGFGLADVNDANGMLSGSMCFVYSCLCFLHCLVLAERNECTIL